MRRALTVLAVGAATLAGCGGGGGAGGDPAVTVPAGKVVEVKASEFKFVPAKIVVDAGSGPVKITLHNDGATAHNLRVEKGGDDVGGTPIFVPGQSQTASLALKPGRYEFLCSVGDHAALGMKGTLEVR